MLPKPPPRHLWRQSDKLTFSIGFLSKPSPKGSEFIFINSAGF